MLQALTDAVQESVHDTYDIKGRQEGEPREGWVLVDYGNVVVHMFAPDRRDYYQLEELWSRGKILVRLQ
jgi:ribosome-associated protein